MKFLKSFKPHLNLTCTVLQVQLHTVHWFKKKPWKFTIYFQKPRPIYQGVYEGQGGERNFKLKFWSEDDSPPNWIRPNLKSESNRPQVSMGVNTRILDGYGGIACERITKISKRSMLQTYLGMVSNKVLITTIFGHRQAFSTQISWL